MANTPRYTCLEVCNQMDSTIYSNVQLAVAVANYENMKKDAEDIQSVAKSSAGIIAFEILTACNNNELPIEEVHCIIHNQDVNVHYNIVTGEEEIEPKADHFHCMCKFRERITISQLASALEMDSQYVEKPKSRGKYAWANMLGYLCHMTENPNEKHQYDTDLVASFTSSSSSVEHDYNYYVGEYGKYWNNQRQTKTIRTNKANLPRLLQAIDNREIRTEDDILVNDDLFDIYLENEKVVKDRIALHERRDIVKAVDKIISGEVVKQIIYIWGTAGSGKTTLAHEIAEEKAKEVKENEGVDMKISIATSRNPMEDLRGAGAGGIVIIDDISSNCLSRDDWLTLLSSNPKESSKMFGARYKNTMCCPYVIIVSNIISPGNYFKSVLSVDNKEDTIDQFIRRFLMMIKVIHNGQELPRQYNLYLPEYTQSSEHYSFGLEEIYNDVNELKSDLSLLLDGKTKPEELRKEHIGVGEYVVPEKRLQFDKRKKEHNEEEKNE